MSVWAKNGVIRLKVVTSPVLLLDGAVAEVPVVSKATLTRVGGTASGSAEINQQGSLGIEMCTLQTRRRGHLSTIGKRTITMLSVTRTTKVFVVNGNPSLGSPPTVSMGVKNKDYSKKVYNRPNEMKCCHLGLFCVLCLFIFGYFLILVWCRLIGGGGGTLLNFLKC